MARRDRANYISAKNSRIKTNGVGAITGQVDSEDRQDIAESACFIKDEFFIGVDWTGLTDGNTLTWNLQNRITAFGWMDCAVGRSAVALTLQGLNNGGEYNLIINKRNSNPLTLTIDTTQIKSLYALRNAGATSVLTPIVLSGPANTLYKFKFNVTDAYIFVEIPKAAYNRGAWSTTDTLPPSTNHEEDFWKVPIGSTWTYGDDIWPQNTIIQSMVDGASTYAQFKKY